MEQPQRKHIDRQTVACIEHAGSHDAIGAVYHKLHAWADAAGIQATGPAVTVFLETVADLDWGHSRFEVCLPVPEGTEGTDDIVVKELPAVDVLATVVAGPYRDVPAHYTEFLSWIDYEGATIAGPPREIYHVHPRADGSGDPAAFRTEIQFPIDTAP